MKMEFPKQGMPGQIEEGEKNLSSEEKVLSSKRGRLFEKLNEEQKELIKQCNLTLTNTKNSHIDNIDGTIKNHKVHIVKDLTGHSVQYGGIIDGSQISDEEAEKLFYKYFKIAIFQTDGSKTELSKEEQKKLDSPVDDLL